MRKRIGEFLIEKEIITQGQVDQILRHGEKTGMRFGDAGMDLGIIRREDLIEVFGPSYAVDFFHLEARYFPKVTQELLTGEDVARLGAVPLGFKTERKLFRTRKVLNIGLLDPERKDAVDELIQRAGERLGAGQVQGTKVFLVLADQLLEVIAQVYGKSETDLRRMDLAKVDPTLAMFFEHGRG